MMDQCVLAQMKPVFFLAKIFGLNWFETNHHHNCSPTKVCEVRANHCGIGSIVNVGLFATSIFCTVWTTWHVGGLISAFFTGVEQVTFTSYVILYYWQTPPLLFIPRFTFRCVPKLWEQLLNVSGKLRTIGSIPMTVKSDEKGRSTLRAVCWTVTLITLIDTVAYTVFFNTVVHYLCSLMKIKLETIDADCYSGTFMSFGIYLSTAAFLLVCICPQIIVLLFFLHCFIIKRLLDRLRKILHYTLVDNSSCISEREKLQRILQLRLLYSKLVDVVRKIGNCFGLQLLMICISSILSLTVAAYIMFTTQIPGFDADDDMSGAPLLGILGSQLYFAIYTLSFLLAGGHMVKKAGDEIHKTLDRSSHSSLQSSGMASDIQFQITMFQNAERTVVSVYGITTVEMKILSAVLANVVTYFLILVQCKLSFDLSNPIPNQNPMLGSDHE